MHKQAASKQQMLSRTANHSTKGSAKGFVDGLGENAAAVLSESERIEARRQALNNRIDRVSAQLDQQKQVSNILLREKNTPVHLESIAKANALREELRRMRAEVTSLVAGSRRIPSDLVERAFVDICKETMTKAQFDLHMRQAKDRVRKKQGMANTQMSSEEGGK